MSSREDTKLVRLALPEHFTKVQQYDVICRKTGVKLGYILRWALNGLPVEWSAYPVRGHLDPHCKHYGDFATRREAVSEVWIMSDAR